MTSRLRNLLLAASAVLIWSGQSHAGIALEPYLSYTVSGKANGTIETTTEADVDNKVSGLMYGARVGYAFGLGLAAGIDYHMGSLGYKNDDGTDNESVSGLGAYVSYDFPILVRAYATYVFQAKSGDSTGNGMKIGVGYTGLPFVAINLELLNSTFTGSNDDDVEEISVKEALTMLTVSVPLSF